MLINYIKLSLRLLIRNPFFTLINVIGLAVGFASFFALVQFSHLLVFFTNKFAHTRRLEGIQNFTRHNESRTPTAFPHSNKKTMGLMYFIQRMIGCW
jgi:hypothetical protein